MPASGVGGGDEVVAVVEIEVGDAVALFEGAEHGLGGLEGADFVAEYGVGDAGEVVFGDFAEGLEVDAVDVGEIDDAGALGLEAVDIVGDAWDFGADEG